MAVERHRLAATGAALLAIATMLGALAAHAWKQRLASAELATLRTGIDYQFYQSLGLLVLALASERLNSALLDRAAQLLLLGIVLFSGSLYLLVVGAPSAVGYVTPLGGLCFIVGWLLAAVALWRHRR